SRTIKSRPKKNLWGRKPQRFFGIRLCSVHQYPQQINSASWSSRPDMRARAARARRAAAAAIALTKTGFKNIETISRLTVEPRTVLDHSTDVKTLFSRAPSQPDKFVYTRITNNSIKEC